MTELEEAIAVFTSAGKRVRFDNGSPEYWKRNDAALSEVYRCVHLFTDNNGSNIKLYAREGESLASLASRVLTVEAEDRAAGLTKCCKPILDPPGIMGGESFCERPEGHSRKCSSTPDCGFEFTDKAGRKWNCTRPYNHEFYLSGGISGIGIHWSEDFVTTPVSAYDSELAKKILALAPDTIEHARGVLLSLQGSSDGFAFSAALDNYAQAVRRETVERSETAWAAQLRSDDSAKRLKKIGAAWKAYQKAKLEAYSDFPDTVRAANEAESLLHALLSDAARGSKRARKKDEA